MKMRGFILWLVVGLSIGQGTVAVAEEEPVGSCSRSKGP